MSLHQKCVPSELGPSGCGTSQDPLYCYFLIIMFPDTHDYPPV
jgi:hypothetical protein